MEVRKMVKMTLISKFTKIVIICALVFSSLSLYSTGVVAKKYNMSYLYFGETISFIEKVNQTNNSIDDVSPSYFDLNADGSLDEKVDPKFVEEMHNINVKVVPFLSNHWDRNKGRAALNNRVKLVNEIAGAVAKYKLDGINVDLENLTDADRDSYTDFIRLLREALPIEVEVSVAVAANPFGTDKGWQGSYDYEQLAKYADYLMLMTYDESYYGSAQGPIASINYVEKSIQYALTKVPADKIVLGLPFYGRYWQNGYYGGRGIPLTDIEKLIKRYNGKVYFDEKSKSPYASLRIPNGSYAVVNGRTLYPGNYTIWFEDDLSIKYKLRLVQKYDLKGTGSWSLNQAPKQIWEYYNSWLNGNHYFVDSENHWAELDILTMLKKGWMVGTADGRFSPGKALTRAEGTVVLVRALQLNRINSEAMTVFKDVGSNNWARNEIEIAYQHGLIAGTSKDTFSPNEPLTRAQMAAILNRVLKYDSTLVDINPFVDVSNTHWAYLDIILLNKNKIFMGFNDGGFHPNDVVTRAQMAALMNRIAADIGKE